MDMMTLLNTPERIKRIEVFEARVKFFTDGGPAKISLSCTDEVIVSAGFIHEINLKSYDLLKQHGEACVLHMPHAFSSMFRQALLEGSAFFADEKEMDGEEGFIKVESDEAVGLTEDGHIRVEKPGWS